MNPLEFEEESEIDESAENEESLEIKEVNVYKHLPEANPLMEKVEFEPYHVNVIYPIKLKKLDPELRGTHKHEHETNMSKLEDSLFYHNKLKERVDRLINGVNDKQKKEFDGTLPEIYGQMIPYYRKFMNQNSKYFATATIDLKTLTKKKKFFHHSELPINGNQTTILNSYRIEFDSCFQSGNLFHVYQRSPDIYDLILHNDVNTKGNNQWFFFKIKNVPKGKTLKFNIVNMVKNDSLFNYGMKPTVFSKVRYQKRQVGWIREGQKVSYQANSIKREHKDTNYYTLSFEYKFIYENDVVYFSHSYPYTYSDLSLYLQNLFNKKEMGKFVTLKNIARTVGKNNIDLVTVTSRSVSNKAKKVVWILARQHPGETTSSFMIEGILDFLTNNTNRTAEYLRDNIVFKIVPMINIDGVIHGNSRCELVGSDPNRKWKEPVKGIHPIVYHIKKAIEKGKNIDMILDLHSHSRKMGSFFYGNTTHNDPEAARVFPLFHCKNDEKFSFENSRFGGGYNTTARNVLSKLLKIPKVYTLETSFYGYEKGNELIQYYPEDLRKMGKSLLESYACLLYNENPQIQPTLQSQHNKIHLKKNYHLKEVLVDLKNQEYMEYGDKDSVGSDSNPSSDEFQEEEIMKILPKKVEIIKKKIKIKNKSKNEKIMNEKKEPELVRTATAEIKKKISEYSRKPLNNHNKLEKFEEKNYNFQKYTSIETKNFQNAIKRTPVVFNNKIVQTDLIGEAVFKTLQVRNVGDLPPPPPKKDHLCIIGLKMEEKEVWINDDEIGTQTYYPKVNPTSTTTNATNKSETIIGRRSLRAPKLMSVINSKENNFLIREYSVRK